MSRLGLLQPLCIIKKHFSGISYNKIFHNSDKKHQFSTFNHKFKHKYADLINRIGRVLQRFNNKYQF